MGEYTVPLDQGGENLMMHEFQWQDAKDEESGTEYHRQREQQLQSL